VESLEDSFERMFEETYQHYKIVQSEINKADRDGREIAHVVAEIGTKRGDIIEISQFPEDGSEVDDGDEKFKARVLAVVPRSAIDEHGVRIECVEALCIVLQPGDIESLDDFAALYGNDEDAQEASEEEDSESVEESVDSNECPCGADLHMCQKNQEVFGGHLND
jgi:hypothetical protein